MAARLSKVLFTGLMAWGWGLTAQAEVQTKVIDYNHDGLPMKGYLAWDDAITEPRPGVLLVHEWWGLNDYAKSRARQLASLGYVAFALDMYGEGRVTEHPTQAAEMSGTVRSNIQKWRDRALAGLNVLKQQPGVDKENLAAIGYCFGGSTVLHLAYIDSGLKGVVSFHGALTPPPADAKVGPKVLICQGGADSFVPSATVDAFAFGMDQAKANYVIAIFSGAKHGFTNPDAGRYGVDALAYDAAADKMSWSIMQLMFDDIFPKKAGKNSKK